MTLTSPIIEGIRRVVDDAQIAGRVPNVRAEAALLRLDYPAASGAEVIAPRALLHFQGPSPTHQAFGDLR
jgi:hypothetical protein